MDKLLSVGELAKTGSSTSRAIRLYVEKGLLQPIRIGRIICFPEAAQKVLEGILRAKRLGFRLDEIGAFQNAADSSKIASAISRIENLMDDARAEISGLQGRLDKVTEKTKEKTP